MGEMIGLGFGAFSTVSNVCHTEISLKVTWNFSKQYKLRHEAAYYDCSTEIDISD